MGYHHHDLNPSIFIPAFQVVLAQKIYFKKMLITIVLFKRCAKALYRKASASMGLKTEALQAVPIQQPLEIVLTGMPPHEHILTYLEKNADLGHARRDRSFVRQVALYLAHPLSSLPQSAGKSSAERNSMSDLASFYRYSHNHLADLSDLRSIRAKATLRDVEPGSDFLVIHDVTLLDYSRHNRKTDRRLIGDHRGKGYEYHVMLGVDPDNGWVRGVVHDTLINATGPDDMTAMDYSANDLFGHFSEAEKSELLVNHRHQMAVHIKGTDQLLKPYHAIDVADREFDDLFILDCFRRPGRDYVIRAMGNRNVQMKPFPWVPQEALTRYQHGLPLLKDHVRVNFEQMLPSVPLKPYKTLPLDKENRVIDPGSAFRFAALSIGAFPVCLYRVAKRNHKYVKPKRYVYINVVLIREQAPPPGQEAVQWVLFASLPIDTEEQIARVGMIYERRWRIEEFNRLLKSGYNVEKIRLDNAEKLGRSLVAITIASAMVMNLKAAVGLPAKGSLTDEQYKKVRQATKHPDDPTISLDLRVFAWIAKMGGWLGRRRDPIGPTVLMRGLLDVLTIIENLQRHEALLREILKEPNLVDYFLRI